MRPERMITGGCRMNTTDQTKEAILRRLLEMSVRRKGVGHSKTWVLIDRLAQHLEKQGDAIGSIALRTKYAAVNLDSADSAVYLNSLALDWRHVGRPYEAELLLRQAVEIERRVLTSGASQHPHRLNNLSTVLIMQGKLKEAKVLLRHAWQLMNGRHDTTSVRILLSRLIISLLESKPPGIYVGRLRTLLLENAPSVAGNITATTKAAVMVDYLKNRLSVEDCDFLHALFRAANNSEEVHALEEFALWRKCAPLELDLRVQTGSDEDKAAE